MTTNQRVVRSLVAGGIFGFAVFCPLVLPLWGLILCVVAGALFLTATEPKNE